MGVRSDNVEQVWDKLAKEFRNWNGVKPRASWFKTGLSERAGYNRLRIMEGGHQAKLYFSLTKDLSSRELRYLHERANVNLEQAQAAARTATVLNLTVFIGAIMIFNQVFPGLIANKTLGFLQSDDGPVILVGAITTLLFLGTVVAVLSYSHGGTSQARDLKHLLVLSLARRALQEGKSGSDIDVASMSSDLRENFISDI